MGEKEIKYELKKLTIFFNKIWFISIQSYSELI